jgi:Phosphomannomutase
MSIFKAYDIRGLFPSEVDEGMAYLIGRAFAVHTGAKRVLVGNDMRPSSEPLKNALIQGLVDQGANVVDIDLCSTPLFYYSSAKHQAGIMVTASHNPKQYNGCKLCREDATPIGKGSGMEEIAELVLNHDFPAAPKGKLLHEDYVEDTCVFVATLKLKDTSKSS